jgi:Holliday junction DNA helicase RuvA
LITSIEGNLARSGLDWADVSIGGFTLRVSVPQSVVEGLGQVGDRVRLFTSLQLKEDSLTLFGFTTEQARSDFEALIGVNGVGPRVALSVLSSLGSDGLALAVAAGDAEGFRGVHGVGVKTANRIVLELKGKLTREIAPTGGDRDDAEFVDALVALGYSVSEAMAALSSLPAGGPKSLEERVRLSLQRMGSR